MSKVPEWIKPGANAIEALNDEHVVIVSVRVTKHYGAGRCVRVYFPETRTYEFYGVSDLRPVPKGSK